jgi:uncharacterized repeat protein (TIGR04076 family)
MKEGIQMDEKEKKREEKIRKRWERFQENLGYTDEELAIHQSNSRHVKVMEGPSKFATHEIHVEVIEASNCGAGYRPGDSFVVDGEGLLDVERSPQKLCVSAIASLKGLVDRMWQAFYHDSDEVLHDTVTCPDVGVHRGGWGEITMRVKAVKRSNR